MLLFTDENVTDNLIPDTSSTFAPNTSSVSFTVAFDMSSTVSVDDYRQRTVLAGISNLGGVFTVIDGVFAMIFGATLITIIFGEFSYEKGTT